MALLAAALFAPVASADTVIQWGEAPSGANTRGTNIVEASNKNIVFTNRSVLVTYNGITNNPYVGGTNYYWDADGRSPYFSAAVNDGSVSIGAILVVENANSGDRITIYGSSVAPGGTYRGMVMWPFTYYYPTQFVSISSVSLAINQRLNTNTINQAMRVVMQSQSNFYISGAYSFGANFTTQMIVFATESWYDFTPFSNGVESIGALASPNISNVQAVGYYFTAENGGSSTGSIGAQVQYFAAQGKVVVPTLTTWGLILLVVVLLFVGCRRLQASHA